MAAARACDRRGWLMRKVRLSDAVQPSSRPLPPGLCLYTIADLAAIAQCSIRHIERLIELGQAPVADRRLGTLARWYPVAVSRWVNGVEIERASNHDCH